VRRHWARQWAQQRVRRQERSWGRQERLLCPFSVWHKSCPPLHLVHLQRRRREEPVPSQQALLPLGRQQEPQTLASSSAAWLGELFFERLPWVGDMLAEVQVTDLLSACHPSGVRVTSDLDQQTSCPLHGHHHWRSSGTLSRAGPEAEPQARPEARCAHGGQRRTPCAELLRLVTQLLRLVTQLLRVVTPGDRHE